MRDIILTRVELYELLWQEPMRTVASDLGLSDVGLAKRCRKARSYRAAVRPSLDSPRVGPPEARLRRSSRNLALSCSSPLVRPWSKFD
jgi:hypothetical protein